METGRSLYLSQVGTIIPHAVPIVFWDSCAILDIIRVLERDSFDYFNKYKSFVDAIENGRLTSITSSLVIKEYDDNYEDTEKKMLRIQRDLINKVKKTANLMSNAAERQAVLDAMNVLDVKDEIRELAVRLWKKTLVINDEQRIQSATHQRTIDKKAPSANKSQYKDAFIWNTYMMVLQELDVITGGVNPASAFVSSNTTDYGKGQNNQTPHSYLENESQHYNGSLHLNVGSLYGYLTKNGVVL